MMNNYNYLKSTIKKLLLVAMIFVGGFLTGVDLNAQVCTADAGTLTADANPVGIENGGVTISATQGVAPSVPTDYEVNYVLTQGTGFIIEQLGSSPSFTVPDTGSYRIHTLIAETSDNSSPDYVDLDQIVLGETSAGDVLVSIIVNGICASLDVTGAPVDVVCTAEAGTLTADADPVGIESGGVTISATEGDAPVVPAGYTVTYVLTSGNGLIIEDASSTPSFDVEDTGLYTIHTLVAQTTDANDPNYLDLGVIDFGTTPASAVLQIVADNDICAALDVTGAPINAVCSADAGTLTADADPVGIESGGVTISATEGDAPVVPAGYTVTYVLTSGNGLIIEDANSTPSFDVEDTGLYTIHTLVAQTTDANDPNYLDLGVIDFGTTPASAVLQIVADNDICAALDVTGAPINVVCSAEAGTLTADADPVGIESGGVTISATEGDAPVVPAGYTVTYVLTSGNGLIIEDANSTPSFDVEDTGLYTIHTLVAQTTDANDPNYLDLGVIDFGTTPASAVLQIVADNDICAALDVTGAPINVVCTAEAGTLTADADPVGIESGGVTISATEGDAPVVPAGYTVTYVLTSGNGLIIEDASSTPSFDVEDTGLYTIHTLVAQTTDANDPNYLDLGVIDFGTTPASAVLQIVADNDICAALDVTGAPINVVCSADAGTLTADADPVGIESGGVTISATEGDAPVVPAGYTVTYVLTSGNGLIIEDANSTPSFDVEDTGLYTIHTLVAQTTDANDPNYLDLGVIDFGTTPASAVLQIVADNDICAALDVTGAPINVVCSADAGTLTADADPVGIESGGVTISATEGDAPVVPAGYTVTYVLTSGNGLIIEDANSTPSFDVEDTGLYTIHTLVAQTTDANDPNYLDLGVIDFGTTPASAVLQIVADNDICAALDVTGAPINVVCSAEAGTLTADADPVGIESGGVTISATEGDAPVVPAGYTVTYVLTSGNGLIIEDANSTPSFDVEDTGLYTIHTLVAQTTDVNDPNYLDLSIVEFGVTPAVAVVNIIITNDICAALDVTGAAIEVTDGSLSIDENTLAETIRLRQNPVENEIVLSNSQNTFINSLVIYDLTGRMVKQINVESAQSEISADVSTMSNGTYFMMINSDRGNLTLRWIKNR